MTIVLDASVGVAALIHNERHYEWAKALISQHDVAGPELFLAEASNILRRLEVSGGISADESTAAQDILVDMRIRLLPYGPFARRIWSLRHNLTCYDAWYVAVAESLGCPLATMDLRIARAGNFNCELILPPDVEG